MLFNLYSILEEDYMDYSEIQQQKEHRLAAIMFTDMHGFSKMMELDERSTLELLDYHNKTVFELVKKHNGNVIKTIGDAVLADFSSVVNAVSAAVEVQNAIYKYNIDQKGGKQLLIRIGIHIGDIWFLKDDALGEGINIASRLQSLAKPGRICVSRDVYNQIYNKLDLEIISLGRAKLKNIEKEIYAFEILTDFDNDSSSSPVLLDKETPSEEENKSKQEEIVENKAESALIKEIKSEIDQRKSKLQESENKLHLQNQQDNQKEGQDEQSGAMQFKVMDKKFSLETLLQKVPLKEELVLKGINKLKEKGFLKQNKNTGEYEFELFAESHSGTDKRRKRREYYKRRKERNSHSNQNDDTDDKKSSGEEFFESFGEEIGKEFGKLKKKKWWPFRKKTPQEYMAKLEKDTQTSDLVSHIAAYGGVNGFLMFINTYVAESGFPWWLIVASGWGIGLLNHIVDFFTKRKFLKQMKKQFNLSEEQFEILKKMHKQEEGIKGHITSYAGVGILLSVIYSVAPGADASGVFWPGIVLLSWGALGVLPHLASHFPKMNKLKRMFNEAAGAPITDESYEYAETDGQIQEIDEYQKIYNEAQKIKQNLLSQIEHASGIDKSWSEEVMPLLDNFLEQMRLLIERDNNIKSITDDFAKAPLEKEIIELKAKMANTQNQALKKEYEKSISLNEKQLDSLIELENQREIIFLRLNAALLSLKQLQIDLARMKGISYLSELTSFTSVKEKSKELSEYLHFLEESHEEVEKML